MSITTKIFILILVSVLFIACEVEEEEKSKTDRLVEDIETEGPQEEMQKLSCIHEIKTESGNVYFCSDLSGMNETEADTIEICKNNRGVPLEECKTSYLIDDKKYYSAGECYYTDSSVDFISRFYFIAGSDSTSIEYELCDGINGTYREN